MGRSSDMACCGRCTAEKGEDSDDCKIHQKAYRSICPSEWVSCTVLMLFWCVSNVQVKVSQATWPYLTVAVGQVE